MTIKQKSTEGCTVKNNETNFSSTSNFDVFKANSDRYSTQTHQKVVSYVTKQSSN
jgi:hypothetical protein